MAKTYGYYRVSTHDQNPELQISALRAAGCHPVIRDVGVSGAKASRPAFDQIMNRITDGDKLIVWRLDRMGRSLRNLVEVNETLIERGAKFESLTEKLDTSTPMGEFVFHILAAVAQLERQIIRERTLAGMAVAAAKGRFPGRPRKRSNESPIQRGKKLNRNIRILYNNVYVGQERNKEVESSFCK
ncbi:recombinase family protein [Hyphomonas johnsonii]|uniref:Resolvase domain protein n=1 Tax=Hyphomonas johnsonii MHS-2 TaxID=1280950 RepID=A0A059FT86_9PROT|nr:recombinase family protein [Hyphomonas johnsonii]KCZ93827.1 Resolvase domain protein [Hyphomonas johnsonii MHS-2]